MDIGIDIGGSHIGIGIVNENGMIVEKIEKRIMSKEKKNIKKTLEDYITEQIKKFLEKYKISKIGICSPGTISNNIIKKSVNLNLENYDLAQEVSKKIEKQIKIRNDCECAAIAENKYGCLKGYDRAVFITLGTGIGGSVIINNKLLDTGEVHGCEFGHMIIEKNGLQCNCGKKGCFEKYGSIKAFKDNLRKALNLDEKTRGQDLIEIIRKNEDSQIIINIINEYIDNLSIGISNIINIFEPEIIGIGGSFVYYSDILLEKLKQNIIEKNYLFNPRKNVNIATAILGNDAGIIGSVN